MIILSGVLVVLAIALLVTGIVTGNTGHEVLGLDGLKLIYVSIGISIISALCLAIGVFLRRKELFGAAESPAAARRSATARSAKTARTAKTKARVGAGDDAPVIVTPAATAAEVPAETSVYVVPGRKRYHLETCRQLAGREKEELTFVEAREEGFTACTACLPDTALAARAALTETVESGETSDAAATAPTETLDTAGTAASEEDPALVTRTDLPVTKLEPETAPDLSGRDEEDAGSGTREIPAAESPAAGEVTEAPEAQEAPEPVEEAEPGGADAEATPESEDDERPLARSRSLFEPLDRDDAQAVPEDAEERPETAEEHAEPAEDAAHAEDAETAPKTATDEDEDAPAAASETEDEHDTRSAAETQEHEPEAPQDAEAEETDGQKTEDAEDTPAAAPAPAPADEDDAAPAEAEPDGDPDLPYVRILSGTKRYHRPDCALIEDIAEDADDLETLSTSEAKERGCTPCLVCQPDKSPSDRY